MLSQFKSSFPKDNSSRKDLAVSTPRMMSIVIIFLIAINKSSDDIIEDISDFREAYGGMLLNIHT